MIDGIKISYDLPNFPQWKENTGISFNTTVNEDTGEVKQLTRNDKKTGLPYTSIEHRAKFETYQLTVNEIAHTGKKTKYILTIVGSLHKNHFGGKNYRRFTFPDLCSQINYFCLNLHLDANRCIIKNFEYGLNLPVNFNPIEYLENNLISYKGKGFDRLKTESQNSIGYDCLLIEYRIKIYDKGLQHGLPMYLMRFERAYKKMTSPKKMGIYTLADLTKPYILKKLQNELLQAWDEVLLFDNTAIDNIDLPVKDENFLLRYRNAKLWKTFKNRTGRKRNKDKFQNLLFKYGSNGNARNEVKELLNGEFKMCTILPGAKLNEEIKNVTVLPSIKNEAGKSKCYGFTVNIDSKTVTPEKRYCKGCGKELNPNQKKGSVFCSAIYVGEERAHQCRNIIFNPSNNFRNKLIKIEANGVLFDVTPFFKGQKLAKTCKNLQKMKCENDKKCELLQTL